MKKIICTTLILVSINALALQDEIQFKCTPSATNPLMINSLLLKVSTEDPDSIAILTFKNGKSRKDNLAYEGDSYSGYHFNPYGPGDGDLEIWVNKKGNRWQAKASNGSKISILNCEKRQ